ncbi:MAG: hypothetical protein RL701_7752 [Pseudomonadota bacterium]
MTHIRKAILFACSIVTGTAALSGGIARAEDQAVLKRLASNGGFKGNHGKQLVAKVNQRLARAADMPPTMADPVRVAVNQAMLGTPSANDQISAAKVRLKLYAGLNVAMLEAMFTPKRGAIATCVRDVSVSAKECAALVAAAGKTSVAKAKKKAAGPAAPRVEVATTAPVPAASSSAQASSGSRFGSRFSSGYQAPAQQAPVAQAPVQQAQPARAPAAQPQAQPRYAAAPAPAVAAAPAPAYIASASPQPAASAGFAGGDAGRKEAYKAQREAYMARQRQQFEERRAKLQGAQAAAAEPAPKPAAPAQAAAPAKAEAAPETPLDADMKAAVAESPSGAAAATGTKAGLDGDFLDGLLDDPLGGTGKAKKK